MSLRDTRWLKRPRFEEVVKEAETGGPPVARTPVDADPRCECQPERALLLDRRASYRSAPSS